MQDDFRPQLQRQGIAVADAQQPMLDARVIKSPDEIMLLTAKGQSVRTRVREIRETGRGARGVKLLTLAEGDKLLSIARIVETEEQEAAAAP